MSNRLVQPECGGPNPLVAAAKLITAPRKQTTTAASVVTPSVRHRQLDFATEFVEQQQQPTTSQQVIANQQATFNLQPHMQARMPSNLNYHHHPHQHQHQHQHHHQLHNQNRPQLNTSIPAASATVGDQLETKYRNDILSADKQVASNSSKLDDLEFWQSLSQAYIGPTTFGARAEQSADDKQEGELTWPDEAEAAEFMKSMRLDDMEYTFDERNPLKDQYENPFEEGLRRLEQGDIPSAALLFEAAVQLEPDNAIAWRFLGTTQAQNEMDRSAIRALRNCLRLDPADQEARLAIAVSLVNETQHREACRHLLEWLMKHERYAGISASLEEFEGQDKHQQYVCERFIGAARMAPDNPDPDVQNALGVLYNMRGDHDKAVDCFKAALSVRQQDCLLWNRLGATLANGNKSDEAVVAYRRALEISPGFLRTRYNLAISLIHLNLYDEAAKQLIQILNTQASGQGGAIRTRSVTSTSIWNTLRTVATLMNNPDLYPTIDGRDLEKCNELIMKGGERGGSLCLRDRVS